MSDSWITVKIKFVYLECVIRTTVRQEREYETEIVFEVIMPENFSKFMKDIKAMHSRRDANPKQDQYNTKLTRYIIVNLEPIKIERIKSIHANRQKTFQGTRLSREKIRRWKIMG